MLDARKELGSVLLAVPARSSVRTRFIFTFGASLMRGSLSFVTGMLLARWMGPNDFGNMSFLLGTFVSVRSLLDMGSSSAFFTFVSQKPRSKRFVRNYHLWIAFQFLAPLCIIGFLFPAAWIETVWRSQDRTLVLLAFTAAFMQNSVWLLVQQTGEAQRNTVYVQSISSVVVIVHLFALGLLWLTGMLGVYGVFSLIAVEYLLAGLVATRRLSAQAQEVAVSAEDAAIPMLRKYLVYCLPFIPYTAMSFVQDFVDRWLLQTYGGGVQQAFYVVGAQLAGISLLATTSILRIFWKEVAEAHDRQDGARVAEIYRRVTRSLFLVGAICAGFLLPWASEILRLVLGGAYIGGTATLAIMFLYPAHQSMGQITGTLLYATEKVRLVVATGIATMLGGAILSYFVLAPPTAYVPGLGFASVGLATKMVIVQVIGVNIMAFIIARVFAFPFDWIFQPVGLFGCLALGWISHAAVGFVAGSTLPVPVVMIVGGILYGTLTAGFVYANPWLAGSTREALRADVRRALAALGLMGHGSS